MKTRLKIKGLIDYDATAQKLFDDLGWSVAVWASRSGFSLNVPSIQAVFRQSYPSPNGRLPQKVVAELRRQKMAVEWLEESDKLAA